MKQFNTGYNKEGKIYNLPYGGREPGEMCMNKIIRS